MNQRFRHIIWWAIFICYESTAVGMASGAFTNLRYYILHYAINISLFYCHASIVLPNALASKPQAYYKLPLYIIAELAIYLVIMYSSDHVLSYFAGQTERGNLQLSTRFIFSGIWRGVYFMGFGTSYFLFQKYIRERDEREEINQKYLRNIIVEKETARQLEVAKNVYLKAQINPHFLFNTLNFIYSGIHKSNPVASKALMYLSKIMRYTLSNDDGLFLVKLSTEIVQAENLIQLWQLRNPSEHLIIDFHYPPEAKDIEFIPLVLLTLLENIFKHGNLIEESKRPVMSLAIENGMLILETSNLVNRSHDDTGTQTGLRYVTQKLFLTYGEKAIFKYSTQGNYFKTFLQAPLNQPTT
jgi:two-component system LytT family sensor kinase